jgi:hypothetical protein
MRQTAGRGVGGSTQRLGCEHTDPERQKRHGKHAAVAALVAALSDCERGAGRLVGHRGGDCRGGDCHQKVGRGACGGAGGWDSL